MRKPAKWLSLLVQNHLSQRQLIDPNGLTDISITSHASRLDQAFCAIESIGNGLKRPRSITLFVGHRDLARAKTIKRLQRLETRGLVVRGCEDVKPHTKYFPYLLEREHFTCPLVTADDDVFYPRTWLSDLEHAHTELPNLIHCHRAKEIQLQGNRLAPYRTWRFAKHALPSHRIFLTGVSGVIYPPDFLHKLKREGDAFKALCPTADDVWLNAMALKHGVKVKQITPTAAVFDGIPGSSRDALMKQNNEGGKNDDQLRKVYTEELILKLCESLTDSHSCDI